MTTEEIRTLLSTTYAFELDDVKPTHPQSIYGWAELDMGYKIEVWGTPHGALVMFTCLPDREQAMVELGNFTVPTSQLTPATFQDFFRLKQYPPAIAQHRRTMLRLLIAP